MKSFNSVKIKLRKFVVDQRYRTKKFIFFCLILSILICYFFWIRLDAPPYNRNIENQNNSLFLSRCSNKIKEITEASSLNDVFVFTKDSNHIDKSFLPYIGNGYVSVLGDGKNNLYLKEGRTVGLQVPYKPLFSIHLKPQYSRRTEASSLNIRNGTLHNYHCFMQNQYTNPYWLEVMYYAHRSIPSLLVQQITINHPFPLEDSFDVSNTNDDFSDHSNIQVQLANSKDKLTISVIKKVVSDISRQYLVLILQSNSSYSNLPSNHKDQPRFNLNEQRSKVHTYFTYVTYKALSPREDLTAATTRITHESLQKFKMILQTNYTNLHNQHNTAWNNLWRSGFSISSSLAQDALNSDRINKTFYYLLSSTRHYLVEKMSSNESLTTPLYHSLAGSNAMNEARQALYATDRCYSGHHTLQSDKLWLDIGNMQEMINIVNIWIITLEKNGCGQMLNAGAEGLIQAMMLSLGGLRFGDKHLEMAIHPRDLHRDLQFRRINYDANTHLSISVRVGSDNRAVIYVSLDRANTSFYACDAGCQDPPMRLSNSEVSLPVKLSSPVTSILYIAPDIQHVNELKHAIHVHTISHAPAHEHDLLALHRHGHRWGGLPFWFWVFLGALILIFHLFLFKLVYNEYCSNHEKGGYMRQHRTSDSGSSYFQQRASMFGHQRRFV